VGGWRGSLGGMEGREKVEDEGEGVRRMIGR
jgi:hypothetical protein